MSLVILLEGFAGGCAADISCFSFPEPRDAVSRLWGRGRGVNISTGTFKSLGIV